MKPGRLILPVLAALAIGLLALALWQQPEPTTGGVPATADETPKPAPTTRARPVRMGAEPATEPAKDAGVDAAVDAEVPISAVRLDALQASVKSFYDSLPPGWKMPEKVRIDEVLPADAIDILGVPPESILDELSHYPMNMKTGLEIVLDMGPEADSVGLAVILPSGRRYLDVLAIVPPPGAELPEPARWNQPQPPPQPDGP